MVLVISESTPIPFTPENFGPGDVMKSVDTKQVFILSSEGWKEGHDTLSIGVIDLSNGFEEEWDMNSDSLCHKATSIRVSF